MNKIFNFLIRLYIYLISPFLIKSCRFYPTCSIYSVKVFKKYKVFSALLFILKRILKCNRFFKGGYDPIP
jgi:uncharacterized protein